MEPDSVQMFERLTGPLNLRLVLQPCIAAIFGYLDGSKDAKAGAPPYFWSVTKVPQEERRAFLGICQAQQYARGPSQHQQQAQR